MTFTLKRRISKRWRGSIVVKAIVAALLAVFPTTVWCQESTELGFSGEVFLPGRILAPTSLPSGEFVLACDDQSLAVVGANSTILAKKTSNDRWAYPVAVCPRSGLIAATSLSGTVDILRWDRNSSTLTSVFRVERRSLPSAAPAWDERGFVHLAWSDATVETWTSEGRLRERHEARSRVRVFVCDETRGTIEAETGSLTVTDASGKASRRIEFDGDPIDVAVDRMGTTWILTNSAVLRWSRDDDAARVFWKGSNLRSLTVVSGAFVVVQSADGVVKIELGGKLTAFPAPFGVTAAPSVDRRGRLWVPTTKGLWQFDWSGRTSRIVDANPVSTQPHVSRSEVMTWGTTSWKTRFYRPVSSLSLAWSSEGGDEYRSRQARAPIDWVHRWTSWESRSDFRVLYQSIDSSDHERQKSVLERLEASDRAANLEREFPFANVLLLKIVRSGLTDLKMDRGRILNDWPDLRFRAYKLLEKYAVLEDRDELADLVSKEYDSNAYPAAISALAATLWDPDGSTMKSFVQIQKTKGAAPGVSAALLDAAYRLWTYTGKIASADLVELVTLIFRSSANRTTRVQAQSFLQQIVETP